MKKLYFLLSGMALSLSLAFAQTPTFQLVTTTATNVVITHNTIFDMATTPSVTVSEHFYIKNITASTQTYTIKKYDNTMNTVSGSDYAEAYFCTGATCYVPTVYAANFVIPANSQDELIVYLAEATSTGLSNVSYDVKNGSEVISVIMRYNFATGIKTNTNELSTVSGIYPNPSSSKSYIDVNATKELNGTNLSVYNCLGSVVSSKEVSLNKGKNTISIDSDNLETGIYFVKIANGTSTITRKLTVTK